MSHFTVLVFTNENGRDYEDLLAPYDENIVVAPYVKYTREQAIAKTRKNIEDYKNGLYAKFIADPDKYKADCSNKDHINYLENEFPKKLNWTDEECYQDVAEYWEDDMKKPNGDLMSTYNPNSKWDWYDVGGRWSNYFGDGCNEDYVSEIDWNDDLIPFAFITPNGEWHEKGRMGWWAMVSNEKEKDSWEKEFMEFIKSCGKDVYVTAVDCHI